jgi:CRISPR-associated protein Cas1
MKKYFAEYEDFINHEFIHPETKQKTSFRKCFRIQIENLSAFINGVKEYSPFLLEI